MSENSQHPIRFRGQPDELEGLVPFHVDPHRQRAHARLEAAGAAPTKLPVRSEPLGEKASCLRFAMPRSTPPGTYDATIYVDDKPHTVHVEVLPLVDLVIAPAAWHVSADPGNHTTANVALFNDGNVPVTIPKVLPLNLLAPDAWCESLGATYRAPEKGVDRVGRFADELAQRAAAVNVAVDGAPLTIEVGEVKTVVLTFRWNKALRAGGSYTGTLPIGNLRWSVNVEVPGEQPT